MMVSLEDRRWHVGEDWDKYGVAITHGCDSSED